MTKPYCFAIAELPERACIRHTLSCFITNMAMAFEANACESMTPIVPNVDGNSKLNMNILICPASPMYLDEKPMQIKQNAELNMGAQSKSSKKEKTASL